MKVQAAVLGVFTDCDCGCQVSTSGIFKQSGIKSLIGAIFDLKCLKFEKCRKNINQKLSLNQATSVIKSKTNNIINFN